jgi:type III secretory pathway lipoprotein EscJ
MSGFSSGQKAMLGMAVLAVVLGGYLFMSWAGQPSYVPLFSNLSSSDAAAITQKLATNKIPYELAEGGEQIMVPESDVYQQRLDMAADGLPSSGDQGYSLLDTAGVTTSEFQQQVEYQQAVSDELEQTIESITGVSSAQVSVVIPQESLFSSSADQPSASVLVSLDPGSTLSAEQVQAIVHLVASSVEGLSPDNVTVADSNGDVLNAPGTDAGNVAAGTMDEQERPARLRPDPDFQSDLRPEQPSPDPRAAGELQGNLHRRERQPGSTGCPRGQRHDRANQRDDAAGGRRKHARHFPSDGVIKDDQDDQGRQVGRGSFGFAYDDRSQRL